jgi:hypothetical protein
MGPDPAWPFNRLIDIFVERGDPLDDHDPIQDDALQAAKTVCPCGTHTTPGRDLAFVEFADGEVQLVSFPKCDIDVVLEQLGLEPRDLRTGPDGETLYRRSKVVLPAPSQPMHVARQLVAEEWTWAGIYTLRRWQGGFYTWTGTYWREVEDSEVSGVLYRKTEHAEYRAPAKKPGDEPEAKPWAPTPKKVGDVRDALGVGVVALNRTVTPPQWIAGPTEGTRDRNLVAVKNGLHPCATGTYATTPRPCSTPSRSRSPTPPTSQAPPAGRPSSSNCGPPTRTRSPCSRSSSAT